MNNRLLSILLAFVMIMILSGCGGGSGASPSGPAELDTEAAPAALQTEATEETTESTTAAEEVTETTVAPEPITLVDDEYFTFKVTGLMPYEPGDFSVYYNITLTNNSDKDLLISSVGDSFKVNGIYVGEIAAGVLETLAPGESVETTLSYYVGLNDKYNYELPENNDFSGARINGKLSVYDDADTSIKYGSYPFEFTWE